MTIGQYCGKARRGERGNSIRKVILKYFNELQERYPNSEFVDIMGPEDIAKMKKPIGVVVWRVWYRNWVFIPTRSQDYILGIVTNFKLLI